MRLGRLVIDSFMHTEFRGIRITLNLYSTLMELDRFCQQMELIARKGLPAGLTIDVRVFPSTSLRLNE
jgi:hypothetical protein